MGDLTLTFGKHKGKKLSQVPVDYQIWLADNAYNATVKEAARERLGIQKPDPNDRYTNAWHQVYSSADEIGELREIDRIQAIEDKKDALEWEEEMKKYRLSWETSGHTIFIEMQFDDVSQDYFHVIVDGGHPYKEYEIEDYTSPANPAIVAKIGRVGLTAERRDALLAMLK